MEHERGEGLDWKSIGGGVYRREYKCEGKMCGRAADRLPMRLSLELR
jgi:hypothetical protein